MSWALLRAFNTLTLIWTTQWHRGEFASVALFRYRLCSGRTEKHDVRGVNPMIQARPNAMDKHLRIAPAQGRMMHPAWHVTLSACGNVLHLSRVEGVARTDTECSLKHDDILIRPMPVRSNLIAV